MVSGEEKSEHENPCTCKLVEPELETVHADSSVTSDFYACCEYMKILVSVLTMQD